MRTCVDCYRPRPPGARKYCRACRSKRIKRQQQISKGINPDRVRICEDCSTNIDDRPGQARLCVSCREERDRAKIKRYDERNREKRRRAAKENIESNREAVRRYKRTAKGKAAVERYESKPDRIKYKQEYNANRDRPVFLYCPNDWTFDRWIDSIIAKPPDRLPILHVANAIWQPFNVPSYLKSKKTL